MNKPRLSELAVRCLTAKERVRVARPVGAFVGFCVGFWADIEGWPWTMDAMAGLLVAAAITGKFELDKYSADKEYDSALREWEAEQS